MSHATIGQHLAARLVAGISWLACHAPAGPLERLADTLGAWRYALAPRAGRDLVRANLRRTCRGLVAAGLASPRVVAATGDERILERLVRSVYRHHARYMLELMRSPTMTPAWLATHLTIESPGVVDAEYARVAEGGSLLVLGLHLGPVEMPAIYSAARSRKPVVGPMEVIANPPLQAWFLAQRQRLGVIAVMPPETAAPTLRRQLQEGGLVGIVADRDITGNGRPTPLFGFPAPLAAGPALLALEARVPTYVASIRRTGWGRYAGRLIRLEVPSEGSLRERVTTFMAAEAAAFEQLIAEAPEQWWALLFPIWPDLALGAADG